MKQYRIKTKFIFEGEFIVTAENKSQAKEFVEKHCGMTEVRGVHSSLPDDTIDWVFPIHPIKIIK